MTVKSFFHPSPSREGRLHNTSACGLAHRPYSCSGVRQMDNWLRDRRTPAYRTRYKNLRLFLYEDPVPSVLSCLRVASCLPPSVPCYVLPSPSISPRQAVPATSFPHEPSPAAARHGQPRIGQPAFQVGVKDFVYLPGNPWDHLNTSRLDLTGKIRAYTSAQQGSDPHFPETARTFDPNQFGPVFGSYPVWTFHRCVDHQESPTAVEDW